MPPTESAPAPAGQFVDANGLKIYYEEHGSGKPLLLLHGGAIASQMWQPSLASFTPHFRVITPDSRGHGKTDNPAGELTYRAMADDMAALIQALQLEAPYVFGYSDGAIVALELAMFHPGVAGAFVIGAAAFELTEQVLSFNREFGMDAPGVVDFERIATTTPEWHARLKTIHYRAEDPDYWQSLLRQLSVMWYSPLEYSAQDFGRIRDPIMYLVGDRDGIVSVEETVTMYRLTKDAELAIIPNATHFSALTELGIGTVVDFFLRQSKVAVTA